MLRLVLFWLCLLWWMGLPRGCEAVVGLGSWVSCARINNEAQIKCWGKNTAGVLGPQVQLGGNTLNMDISTLNVLDLGTNTVVEEIAINDAYGSGELTEFACARLNSGQVKCWGDNRRGQLGLGHTQNRGTQASHMGDYLPFVNLGTNRTARQISLGRSFACAVLDNWKVRCWGRNDVGQLGSNLYTDDRGDGPGEMGDSLAYVEFPAPFQGLKVMEIRTTTSHAVARLENGQICLWGGNDWQQLGVASLPSDLSYTRTPICPNMFGQFAQEISVGFKHTCAVLSASQENATTGAVYCWGESSKRQCGRLQSIVPAQNSTHWNSFVMEVSLPAQISVGSQHSCARFDLSRVKCWGGNFESSNSSLELALNLGFGRSVKALHCGSGHCCARLDDGQLKCWGSNDAGQLGWKSQTTWVGAEISDNLPILKFNDCGSLKCGVNGVCFRTNTVDAECRCEIGSYYDISIFRVTRESSDMGSNRRFETNSCRRLEAMTLGRRFSCVTIGNAAQVKCWGLNDAGVLGPAIPLGQSTLDINIASLPVLDLGTDAVVEQLSSGQVSDHVCALLSNGEVKCWGNNAFGQLGQGDKWNRGIVASQMGENLPSVKLGTNRTVIQIASGQNFNCVLLDNLKVKCWGENGSGQLGVGSLDDKGDQPGEMGDNLPYVNLPRNATAIRAGYKHAAARLDNGQLCLWGLNNYKQLGVSNPEANKLYRTTPVCLPSYNYIALDFTVSQDHTCAILASTASSNPLSRLHCWGSAKLEQFGMQGGYLEAQSDGAWQWNLPLIEAAMNDKLAAGKWLTCLLDSSTGSVRCAGTRSSGQHGNSTWDRPVDLGDGNMVKDVACGEFHCCARFHNQQMKCWGSYYAGQLGFKPMKFTVTAGLGVAAEDMGENLPIVKFNDCGSLNCGANAACTETPAMDAMCQCQVGYTYDTSTLRVKRLVNDLHPTSRRFEVNSCKRIDTLFQVSNMGFRIFVDIGQAHKVSLTVGLTGGQLNPASFGPPLPLSTSTLTITGGSAFTVLVQNNVFVYNGQEFYLYGKALINNETILDTRFVLPCGCNAQNFTDYPPVFPRSDDGRPISGRVVQRKGKIFVSWTDNSNCATQFSLHRVLPNETMALYLAGLQDDIALHSFALSDEVYAQVAAGSLTSVSVVSDFVLDSTNCFKRFAPFQFLDDMAQSRLAAGARVIYCMTSSNPSLNFASGFSCIDRIHSLFEEEEADLANGAVSTCADCRRLASEGAARGSFNSSGSFFWETQFRVRVLAGKYTNTPVKNVNISWSVTLVEVDESGPKPVDLSRPIMLSRPSMCISDVNGECEVSIIASSELNPGLLQSSVLSVAVFAAKTSIVPQNQTVEHSFTCEEPARDCPEDRPLVIETAHLVGGNVYVFRDMTTVGISGKVTLDGTQDAEYGVELGCPLQGAEVCAYAADMEQEERNKYDCTKSAANGDYTVVVPMQKSVALVVTMKDSATNRDHEFASQGWDGASFKVGLSNVQGKHFMDITKETLYVDVFGGNCQIPLASAVEVELTKKRSGCGNWAQSHFSSDAIIIPPTSAPTQEPTTSPTLPTAQPTMSPDAPPTRNPTTKAPSKSPTPSPIEFGVITNHPTYLPSKSPTRKPTTGQPTTRRPTSSPTVANRFVRYRFVVPATEFEVSIAGLTSPSSDTNELLGVLDHFQTSPLYRGENQPTVNLTFVSEANSDNFTMQADRLASFRFDVEPVLDLQFYQGSPENRVDVPNHASCGSRARVLNLDFSQTTWARVTATQTFFDGMTCNKVSGKIIIQDNLWESGSANPSLQNECKQLCTVELVDKTETVAGFAETFSVADREIEPVPEITSPHVNSYVIQYSSDILGASPTRYVFTILTPGDIADAENRKYDVSFMDPILLTIVRDPPGDASVQTLTNAETTLVVHSTDYSGFWGITSTLKSGGNVKFEGETCAFGVFCGTMTEVNTNMGLVVEETFERPIGTAFQGTRTLSRTYTWSYSTPSMLNSALKKRTRGADSDMFLVVATAVVFIPTITVVTSETAPCAGDHIRGHKWLTPEQLRAIQGNIATHPDTVMWVSRADIRDRIIPELRNDNNLTNDQYIQVWESFLTRADQYKFVRPVKSKSDKEKLVDALQDFAKHPAVGVLEAAAALEIAGMLSADRDSAALYKEVGEDSRTTMNRRKDEKAVIDKFEKEFLARPDIKTSNNPVYIEQARKIMESSPQRRSALDKVKLKYANEAAGKIKAQKLRSLANERKVATFIGKLGGQFLEKTPPFVGMVFNILELALAAGYMGAVMNETPVGGTNTSSFEPQDPGLKRENQESIFAGSELPLFRALGKSPRGLWGKRDNLDRALKMSESLHEATMISFSGGGSTIEFSVSDLDDSTRTSRVDGYSSNVNIGTYGDSSMSPGIASDGTFKFHVSTNLFQTNTNQETTESSATVTFGDSTPGDYFLVQVFRDQEFGTFVFNTIAGRSKCPYEQGTITREEPDIDFVTPPEDLTHPDQPATFFVKLGNKAIYDGASYTLEVGHLDVQDDVQILANGMLLDKPVVFDDLESLHSYPVLIQVYRGSQRHEYNFTFILRSMCESDLKSELQVSIRFAQKCPEPILAGVLAQNPIVIRASDSQQVVTLSVRHPNSGAWLWTNYTNVQHVGFQFLRFAEDDWLDAENVENGDGIVEMIPRENRILHFASYDWDLSLLQLQDNTVRVRAIVECDPGDLVSRLVPQNAKLFEAYSEVGIIRIDRVPPLVFRVHPQVPFPGTDELVIEFTEPIRCGPPLPFSVTLTANVSDDMVGLQFDQSSGNLLVKCEDRKISLSIPSNIPARKLLNLKATVGLRSVRDMVGNLAQANIAADSDRVQVDFVFGNIDLNTAKFSVRSVIVPGIVNKATCENKDTVLDRMATATGLPKPALTFYSSEWKGTSSSCAANLVVSGAEVAWTQVSGRRLQEKPEDMDVGTFFDDMVDDGVIEFMPGGGIDVVPPVVSPLDLEAKVDMIVTRLFGEDDFNHSSNCSATLQQELAFRALDELDDLKNEMVVSKTDLNVVKTDLDEVKRDLNEVKGVLDDIKTLVLSLANSSIQGATGSQKDGDDSTIASGDINSNVVAIILVTIVATVTVLGGVLLAIRKFQKRKTANAMASRARRTGEFVVVGSPGSADLQMSAYNEYFSPHPVFGTEQKA